MKNILIIHHGRGVGGGLIALIGLIDELKTSYHVEVFSLFDGIAVQYIRKTGVNVIIPKSKFYLKYYELFVHSAAAYFNLVDAMKKLLYFILYLLSKYYFAKKELEKVTSEYEVVYLNSTFISDWALAARQLEKSVVIHIREPLSKGVLGFRRRVIRETIRKNCNHIIAISHDNANRIGILSKTSIVYDPVVKNNRDCVKSIDTQDSLNYFLYLGGMMRIKGFEQFVNALDYLSDNIRIFFLGSEVHFYGGSIKHKIRQLFQPYIKTHELLVKKLMASPNIVYVGQTDDVFLYYKKSIALISPFSRPHASLPILEAFSLGLPVIVSDIKGMDELVDGKNGVFFENDAPKSLANRINEMALLTAEEYDVMKAASFNTYRRIRESSKSVLSVIETL